MAKRATKESVFEEIKKAGKKGKKLTAKSKISYLEQLEAEGKIIGINSKYYATGVIPTSEEVYRKIKEAGEKGIKPRALEVKIAQDMINEGEIIKIGSMYYAAGVIPTSEEVYRKIKEAGEKGIALLPLEVQIVKGMIKEGKIKKVSKKHYLEMFAPLTQKNVIDRLLSEGFLKRSGKNYIFVGSMESPPEPVTPPVKIPSFLEFVETLQKIYLRKAREYRKGISILPLIEEVAQAMDISNLLVEKWVLELPGIFIGIVDLRSFPGEHGLKMKNGTEISRIYLERGIVGL